MILALAYAIALIIAKKSRLQKKMIYFKKPAHSGFFMEMILVCNRISTAYCTLVAIACM